MCAKHGEPIRGLISTKASRAYEGRFGRMFRSVPAAVFGSTDPENVTNLAKLGAAMTSSFDPPRDGKDGEESGIPALYTYFGQFIDHDITFDPASSLQKQNDPDALVDFRTPALDLDSLYGRGPADQPYLYDGETSFLLGNPIRGGSDPTATDLPRNDAKPRRALVGDPRNDENAIVSQLHGLFLRFHNRAIAENPGLTFADAQRAVRFHYQYLVLHDFLPRIVHPSVLDDLRSNGRYDRKKLKFFHWKQDPFMPVEFSVASFRYGHAMVRSGYRLNDTILLPIFPVLPQFADGLDGFKPMHRNWGIDWGRFIGLDVRDYDGADDVKARRLQFAHRIDTSLVNPLSLLPLPAESGPPSLALRNLLRGWQMGLPSGQGVARAMGLVPLPDQDIRIGRDVDAPATPLMRIVDIDPIFAGNCPLWTYVLAEAMQFKQPVRIPVTENVTVPTPQLGPVGGRIVAEVLLGLIFGDPNSILNLAPDWRPTKPDFALRDFVSRALGR